jgi:hypothetical protein
MGAPGYALRTPRVFRLPRVRVKFKKPRWPRGNRSWLFLLVWDTAWAVYDLTMGVVHDSPFSYMNAGLMIALAIWAGVCWKRSRNDDDGPRST